MIVVVTGGRYFGSVSTPSAEGRASGYRARKFLTDTLDKLHNQSGIDILVQGGADGADSLARKWADRCRVVCVNYPANRTDGKEAGPVRNAKMLRFAESLRIFSGTTLAVVAFTGDDSTTADCLMQARHLGIAVIDHKGGESQ